MKATIFVIFALAAVPNWAHAQNAVTKADAQEVIEIISSDEAKTKTYCDIVKLGDQIEQADQNGETTNQLTKQMNKLAANLGPEYVAVMGAFQDIDPRTMEGQETGATMEATIEALNKLCGPMVQRSRRD
jgi:hypothetical protein